MQDIERYKWRDGDRAKSIENFVELEQIPEDVRANVLNEFVIRATCQHCHVTHHYISMQTPNEVDCKTAGCDSEIVLP